MNVLRMRAYACCAEGLESLPPHPCTFLGTLYLSASQIIIINILIIITIVVIAVAIFTIFCIIVVIILEIFIQGKPCQYYKHLC